MRNAQIYTTGSVKLRGEVDKIARVCVRMRSSLNLQS